MIALQDKAKVDEYGAACDLVANDVYANQTFIIDRLGELDELTVFKTHNGDLSGEADDAGDPWELHDFLLDHWAGSPTWKELTGVEFDPVSEVLWEEYDVVKNWVIEHVDEMTKEVHQWYLVSSNLGAALMRERECVLEYDEMFWWGRTQSGQLLADDGVIRRIVQKWEA